MLIISECEHFALVSEVARLEAGPQFCSLADWKMWLLELFVEVGGEERVPC